MRPVRVLSAVLLGAMALAPAVSWRHAATAGDPAPQAKNPAALIDASRYPHLQAALDAVPEAGGLARRLDAATGRLEKESTP